MDFSDIPGNAAFMVNAREREFANKLLIAYPESQRARGNIAVPNEWLN